MPIEHPASGGMAIASLKLLDTSKLKSVKASEVPEELFQRMMDTQETMLRQKHTQPPDLSKNPAYQTYATVTVNGTVIATLDNNGMVATSNSVGASLQDGLPGLGPTGKSGPLLAQQRAEVIARMFGGSVVASKTAMTQERYDATPKPTPTVDQKAMMEDDLYRSIQDIKQARLRFLAQQMA